MENSPLKKGYFMGKISACEAVCHHKNLMQKNSEREKINSMLILPRQKDVWETTQAPFEASFA